MAHSFLLAVLVYCLIVFQAGFLAHFSFNYYLPNIALSLVLLYNLLEEKRGRNGLFLAAWCGLWLDIFTDKILGFHILLLVLASLFVKFVLKRYVRIPTEKRI